MASGLCCRLEWISVTLDNVSASLHTGSHQGEDSSPSKLPSPLPKNAVAGGVTAKGEVMYVARACEVCFRAERNFMTCYNYIPSERRLYGNQSMEKCDILVCHDPDILHWVDVSGDVVPKNAIAVKINEAYNYKQPEYIARNIPDSSCERATVTMCFGLNKSDYSAKLFKYQILCAYLPPPIKYCTDSPYTWVPASDGYIPENGLIGGKTEEGEDVYVAGVDHVKGFDIGYVVPSKKVCYYIKNLEPMSSSSYKIFVPSIPSHFHWSTANEYSSVRPHRTYVIGHNKQGVVGKINSIHDPFTMGGMTERDSSKFQVVGPVLVTAGVVLVSYRNEVLHFNEYESLIADMVPNSLQELCRYVILESTSGVPHRINRLPLPQKMKDYCQLRSDEMHHTVQLD